MYELFEFVRRVGPSLVAEGVVVKVRVSTNKGKPVRIVFFDSPRPFHVRANTFT